MSEYLAQANSAYGHIGNKRTPFAVDSEGNEQSTEYLTKDVFKVFSFEKLQDVNVHRIASFLSRAHKQTGLSPTLIGEVRNGSYRKDTPFYSFTILIQGGGS